VPTHMLVSGLPTLQDNYNDTHDRNYTDITVIREDVIIVHGCRAPCTTFTNVYNAHDLLSLKLTCKLV
jgi:hypothetical protein